MHMELSFGVRVIFARWGNPDVVLVVSPALFSCGWPFFARGSAVAGRLSASGSKIFIVVGSLKRGPAAADWDASWAALSRGSCALPTVWSSSTNDSSTIWSRRCVSLRKVRASFGTGPICRPRLTEPRGNAEAPGLVRRRYRCPACWQYGQETGTRERAERQRSWPTNEKVPCASSSWATAISASDSKPSREETSA